MTDAHAPVTDRQVERLRSQLDFLLRNGQRYRTVQTDSESTDGIMLVCTSPDHPADDQLAQRGVYTCCDFNLLMELRHEKAAAFFVSATIAIPALLAEREQLQAERDAMEEQRDILRYQLSGAQARLDYLEGRAS